MVAHRVDLDKIPHVDCFKALLVVLDKLIEDEETQVVMTIADTTSCPLGSLVICVYLCCHVRLTCRFMGCP